jgi:hypothetical protein
MPYINLPMAMGYTSPIVEIRDKRGNRMAKEPMLSPE